MGSVLDKIRSKITRAEQHLRDFQLGLSAFYQSGPYAVAMKEDAQRGERIYYVTKLDCVPDSLTTIAADVIQNLRSPLDQIAHQLVLDARGGTPPDWLVYYPIVSKPSEYKATRGGKIKGVRQEVIDAIDATEPYPGGKGHALWQLNELNKPDKHILLIGAAVFTAGIDLRPDFIKWIESTPNFFSDPAMKPGFIEKIEPLILRETRTVPLKLGDEILIEPLDVEVTQNRRFTFEVSLNASGVIKPEPAIKTLQDMTNLVRDIVERLGTFLP